jgi:hypothetical protein
MRVVTCGDLSVPSCESCLARGKATLADFNHQRIDSAPPCDNFKDS